MDDLKLIKKYYGEKMSHLCRDLFPTELETPGLLYETISKKFYPTRFLYDDLINTNTIDTFENIIKSELTAEKEEPDTNEKSPEELLKEVGYTLYECKSEADIQSFRKYYKRTDGIVPVYKEGTTLKPYNGEELCTFNGGRLSRCYVFFAVKDGAEELKREDFNGKEERQDEYGTSVISIQFSKGPNNTLSIKNRYNHTVNNPDATFSNNLDNIVPGLTKAFEKKYNYSVNSSKIRDSLPGYVLANDGRYYKYNYERNNKYYCPDNIVIDNFDAIHYDKSRYIVFENFILDMQQKTIKKDGGSSYQYISPETFQKSIKNISNIRVEVDKETNEKTITMNDGKIVIVLTPTNQIKKLKNEEVTVIDNHFLLDATKIEEVDLPNVTHVFNDFLVNAELLRKINLPKCTYVGYSFLQNNRCMEEISLPEAETIGSYFLYNNQVLKSADLPKVGKIDSSFLSWNKALNKLNLPVVEQIGSGFLENNEELEELYLPKLRVILSSTLSKNQKIKEISLPNVKIIGMNFLNENNSVEKIDLPKCDEISDEFLPHNKVIKEVNLPICSKIGDMFLARAKNLKKIDLPLCKMIGNKFLILNTDLEEINLPECMDIGDNFLMDNLALKSIELPMIRYIGKKFLYSNKILFYIDVNNCEHFGENFLEMNEKLKELEINNAWTILGKETNREELIRTKLLPHNKIVTINGFINRKKENKNEKSESDKSK